MSVASKSLGGEDEFARVQRAAEFILQRTETSSSQRPLRPRIALVLGSGLGAFADDLVQAVRIPYAQIPFFPRSTAIGHAGQLVIGLSEDIAVAAMQGRAHLYEGYSARDVVFPLRVFSRMGIQAVVLTNAAGGISPEFKQGCLVALNDHINLQGQNPLVGENDERLGPRFPDMSRAYDPEYRKLALEEGRRAGIEMFEGVYAAVLGPSYETPAEIRFLRTAGADLVGMSTVAEVIAARHLGMRVLAISCVTNMAAGILDQPIDHREVLETGERVRGQFAALLRRLLPRIQASLK